MNGSVRDKLSPTQWAVNPRVVSGVVVIALGLIMLVATLTDSQVVGQMIVLLLGVIFLTWGVMVRHPGPLIPGCILSGLGVGIVVSQWLSASASGQAQGGIVTLCLGLGFLLIMPVQQLVMRQTAHWWPLIPGGMLSVTGLGILVGDPEMTWIGRLWPLAVIGVGAVLLYQALRPRRPASDLQPPAMPPSPPATAIADTTESQDQRSNRHEPVEVS
jgi:hypothetical protein